MRIMLILVWCGAIFVFTCTASFYDFIHYGSIRFHLNAYPKFSEFLSPFPPDRSSDLLLQKLGHIGAFILLTFLLLKKFSSKVLSLLLAASFAALTEILQLYFNRDGRFFDIGFDLIGVFIAWGIASLLRKNPSKQINLRN